MPQVLSLRPMELAGNIASTFASMRYRKLFDSNKMVARFHLPCVSETVALVVNEKFVFTGPPQRSPSDAAGAPPPAASPPGTKVRHPLLSPGASPRS